MKRYGYILAAAAVALTACAREDLPLDIKIDCTTETAVVKTALAGDFGVVWTNGDQLAVVDESGVSSVLSLSRAGSAAASFTGKVAAGKQLAMAVYPAASLSDAASRSVTVPDSQTLASVGTFASGANVSAGVPQPSGDGWTVTMKNLCGLVRFSTTGAEVTSVALTAASGKVLAGTVVVDCSGDGPSVSSVKDGKQTVVASAASGRKLTGGTYYLAVLPADLSGAKVKVTYSDGKTEESAISGQVAVKRNCITDIGNVNPAAPDALPDPDVLPEISKKEEEDPMEPAQKKSVALKFTLDFLAGNPFDEDFPTSGKAGDDKYHITRDGVTYEFMVCCNTGTYYRNNSSGLRLDHNVTEGDGCIMFPAVPDLTLTRITFTLNNSSTYKELWVSTKPHCPSANADVYLMTRVGGYDTATFELKDAKPGVAYYLNAWQKNTQFKSIILEYY